MNDRTTQAFMMASVSLLGLSAILAYACPLQTSQANRSQPQAPHARTMPARVTAYCPCVKCCGKFADGKTSTGVDASTMGVAVDPKVIPYGATLHIPGYGTVKADDTGSAMRKPGELKLDVRFRTHQEALEWGVRYLDVEIR